MRDKSKTTAKKQLSNIYLEMVSEDETAHEVREQSSFFYPTEVIPKSLKKNAVSHSGFKSS